MTGAQANFDLATIWARSAAPHLAAALNNGALTYREVADYLNAHGVLTRHSGRWHASTVQRTMRYLGHPPGLLRLDWFRRPAVAPIPPAPPARQGSIIDPRMRRLRT